MEKKEKRILIFKGDVLAENKIFTSYGDARRYVESNSDSSDGDLKIKRLTNRAILRTVRDMIGREGTESTVLRLLDIVIEDTEN